MRIIRIVLHFPHPHGPSFHPSSNHIESVLDFLTNTDQDGWVRYEQSPGLNVLESNIAKALASHFHHLEQPFRKYGQKGWSVLSYLQLTNSRLK